MKALVTGGCGFIGSNLVTGLITKGHTVTVVDNLSSGTKDNINVKAEYIFQDLAEVLLNEKKYNVILKNLIVFFTCGYAKDTT